MSTKTSLTSVSLIKVNADGHQVNNAIRKRKNNRNEWETIFSDWRNSGLSQRAFCRLRQIPYHNFLYHRAKRSKKIKALQKNLNRYSWQVMLVQFHHKERLSSYLCVMERSYRYHQTMMSARSNIC